GSGLFPNEQPSKHQQQPLIRPPGTFSRKREKGVNQHTCIWEQQPLIRPPGTSLRAPASPSVRGVPSCTSRWLVSRMPSPHSREKGLNQRTCICRPPSHPPSPHVL